MSCSEDETNAASVLSQLSQSAQQTSSESVIAQHIDSSAIAHECDVETSHQEIDQHISVDAALEATSAVDSLCDDAEPKLQKTLAVSTGTVKVYPCEYCGKVFNKSYNLKTHHRVHSGERPYQCTVCGHGFANLGDLKRHDRTHTGEKPYTCEYCSKSFSDFGSHKRHLRLHTGYKPFKCEKCDREFTRLDSYKNHVRLHTDVRPYKCEECQREFNYLTTYKRHQNVHSGERPYACDLCGKKFTRSIYVRNHKLNSCGKQKGKKSEVKEEINETTMVTLRSELGEEIADGSIIENIAHDLSMQNGVQLLNVAKVIYTNGETQPVLIESSDTSAHTLILTTAPEDGQQLLKLAAGNKVESSVSQDSAGNIFFTQSLPSLGVKSAQHTSPKFVTLNPKEQDRGIELRGEESKTDGRDGEGQLHGKSAEITMQGQDGSTSNPSAMYIAIEPTQ